MENIEEFSQITKENIGYYVYCLIDPRKDEIFYIGKGCGCRVFAHQQEEGNNPKNIKIQEIQKAGLDIKKYIIRYGLTEEEAFHLEAALIDIFSARIWSNRKLLNIMGGHHCLDYGMKSVDEVEAYFCVESISKSEIHHNALIININKSYTKLDDIYEATRKSWVLSENKLKEIELVFSEYKSIFRRIFRPVSWHSATDEKGRNRWMFEGIDVSEQYPQYVNKKNGFKKQGQSNPVQMIWGNKEKNHGF